MPMRYYILKKMRTFLLSIDIVELRRNSKNISDLKIKTFITIVRETILIMQLAYLIRIQIVRVMPPPAQVTIKKNREVHHNAKFLILISLYKLLKDKKAVK